MEFCIISPTAGLEKYATLSKTHLVLAHVNSNAYKSFYQQRRREGDTLILDNGAHEQGASINWGVLENSIYLYNPQIAVLPDTLNDPIQTASDSLRFLDRVAGKFPNVDWMYVVQAHDGSLRRDLLEHVLTDPRVGRLVKWLGITRYLSIGNGLRRSFVKKSLEGYGKKFHALGMVNGSIDELRDLAYAGFHSCDSSVPVWRGWNGYVVGDKNVQWPEISVDFDAPLHKHAFDVVVTSNLLTCLEAASADTTEIRRRIAGNVG